MASVPSRTVSTDKLKSAGSRLQICLETIRMKLIAYTLRRRVSSTIESYKTPGIESYVPLRGGLYEPLKEGQIRLLRLKAGRFKDNLSFEFKTCDLDKVEVKYLALSYVWGDQTTPRRAWMNGKSILIGANLDSALRHIRWVLPQETWIWADALCINQQDNEERNHQVALMARIYASADEVSIWLEPVFYEKNWQFLRNPDFFYPLARSEEPRKIDWFLLNEGEEKVAKTIDSFASICKRSWFRRMWIIQEFALARQDPVFYIGYDMIPWKSLRGTLETIWDRDNDRYHDQVEDLDPKIYHERAPSRASYLWQMRDFYASTGGTDLLSNIRSTRLALATDPRDRVFSLLGLCTWSPGSHAVVADYSKTTAQVFSEATFSMLQGSIPYLHLPLRLPYELKGGFMTHIKHDLPSWAIDLEFLSHSPADYSYLTSHFTGSGQSGRYRRSQRNPFPSHVATSHAFTRLYTHGLPLGTITATCDMRHISLKGDSVKDCMEYLVQLRRFYHAHLKQWDISIEEFLDIVHLDPNVDSAEYEGLDWLLDGANAWREPAPIKSLGTWIGVQPECSRFRQGHILFVTDLGRLGDCYHPDHNDGARIGDELVSLFAFDYPFVLRPVKGGLDGNSAYTMLNLAFVSRHTWGHDFLDYAGQYTQWSHFRTFGLKEYMIV